MILCAEDENGELALMVPEKKMPAGAEIANIREQSQKAVRACTIKLLTLRPVKHSKVVGKLRSLAGGKKPPSPGLS